MTEKPAKCIRPLYTWMYQTQERTLCFTHANQKLDAQPWPVDRGNIICSAMGRSCDVALQAAPTSIPETLSAAMSLLQYNSGLAAFRSAAEDEAAMHATATGSALAVHKVSTVNG